MAAKREREDGDLEEVVVVEASESEAGLDVQRVADVELLGTCQRGSVADVLAALRKGGHVNAEDQQGSTGLILACGRRDWSEAFDVVKLLLAKRFARRAVNQGGLNALHRACQTSSAEIV